VPTMIVRPVSTVWTRLLSFVLSLAVVLFAVAPALATSIQTDLWVYQYGDTVSVSGDGFGAAEAVEIVTTDPYGVEVDRGTAQTDDVGYFSYSFVLLSDVPGIYDVVATGLLSGLSATTQFDPNNFAVAYSQTPDPVQYSDVATLSGSLTCSHTGSGAACPSDLSGSAVLVELNTGGGFVTIGTTTTGAGSPAPWSTTWQAHVLPGGPYASKATASGGGITGTDPSSNNALTVAKENTTVSYIGGLSGTEFTSLSLSALVSDSDLSKIYPDTNLAGVGVVTFQLRNDADTLDVGAAVTADLDGFGNTIGTLSLTLPGASGSPYRLRTTFAGNGYYLGNSSLVTIVVSSANTPPSVSVTGVTDGSSYTKGSVPVAGCAANDAEDATSNFAASLSAISGPNASDGLGSQTASCSYTDTGGLMATASATYSIVDSSAPAISYVVTPSTPDGINGWYKTNVTLIWTVSEPDSPGSLVKTECVDQTIVADQAATTYSCSATSAGGSAGPVSVTIKRDGTAPVITDNGPTPGAPDGLAGWYVNPLTNNFSASDGSGSGLDAACALAFPKNVSSGSAEGSTVTVPSGTCADLAGNSNGGISSAAFKIDLTAPVITTDPSSDTCSLFGLAGWCRGVQTAGFSATDATSGVTVPPCATAGDNPCDFTQSTSTEGAAVKIASGDVYDVAGNKASSVDSAAFKIDSTAPTSIQFIGINAQTYPISDLPAGGAISCIANGDVSGLSSCVVTGYSAAYGSHTLTATATDNAGGQSVGQLTYLVGLASGGILSPVYSTANPDDSNKSSFKIKSVIPIKFNLYLDAAHTQLMMTPPTGSYARLSLFKWSGSISTLDAVDFVSAGSANTDGLFRWTGSPDYQYVYNLATSGKSPGTYYVYITLYAQDGSVLSMSLPQFFVLRQ
jgi:hypothetical protein